MDRLSDISLFLKVLDSGSISAAAYKLNLSPAVASKRLQNLEKAIGVCLLHRTTRRLSATPEGTELAVRGRPLVEGLQALTADLGKITNEISGTLRVTAGVSFGHRFITPLLSDFFSQYPNVNVHLHLRDEYVDIIDQGYDLAIRISTRMKTSGLIARKLGDSRRVLCASPSYLQYHGIPTALAELVNHRCLVLTENSRGEETWNLTDTKGQNYRIAVTSILSSNMGDALYEAALSGLGISLHSTWHVQRDLKQGRIQVVLPDYFKEASIYAVMPQREFVPARVKAFIKFIENRIKAI
ncbi:LysR family transcriptional regulator [uncultured Desulfuromusa sp.]|uniref:LysR family transcriptional regulator n=1 Tax=uncultured Desulfuromusa sp. TaxID=219183 RepID=UPI002AA6D71F|nr:LysR family transcriptional regulator [uncultured Desulfuromusa sp.]